MGKKLKELGIDENKFSPALDVTDVEESKGGADEVSSAFTMTLVSNRLNRMGEFKMRNPNGDELLSILCELSLPSLQLD